MAEFTKGLENLQEAIAACQQTSTAMASTSAAEAVQAHGALAEVLSTYMIHYANTVRPNPDGMKVGGHQASCASVVSLMTALYFAVLRPQDHMAVKPHASPVLHAIQSLRVRFLEACFVFSEGVMLALMSHSRHKRHNVSVLIYHVVCPAQYRRVVCDEEVDTVLKEVCLDRAKRYEIAF